MAHPGGPLQAQGLADHRLTRGFTSYQVVGSMGSAQKS